MRPAVDALNPLLTHAYDMVRAYGAALDRIGEEPLRATLEAFRMDHERHLSDLTALILRLGGQPRGRRGARGPLFEGMAAFSALFGDAAILRALHRAEEIGLRAYSDARREVLIEQAQLTLQRGGHDHARHLGWLAPAIREREALGEARP